MANNQLMSINYETALGNVQLDAETVKQYLVRGNGRVSDQEVFLFIKMCEAQKLNPFATGEVYLIKFGDQPAQLVVGYDTYKRRAEENPNHLYTESGIVVVRGQEVVQKQGACLYPTEKLIGGWCRVHKLKNNKEVTTYKECGLDEYDKKQSVWKDKPCMMMEKVAVSQALREAYPKDYEGLYTEAEISPTGGIPASQESYAQPVEAEVIDEVITQSERQSLFSKAHGFFGKEEGNAILKELIQSEGLSSTTGMTKSQLARIDEQLTRKINERAAAMHEE